MWLLALELVRWQELRLVDIFHLVMLLRDASERNHVQENLPKLLIILRRVELLVDEPLLLLSLIGDLYREGFPAVEQFVIEEVLRGDAVLGLEVKHALQELDDLLLGILLWVYHILRALIRFLLRHVFKGIHAIHHRVKYQAHAVDICEVIVVLAGREPDLRCLVVLCPDEGLRLLLIRAHPEVRDLIDVIASLPAFSELYENIIWLEVAMDDLVFVKD